MATDPTQVTGATTPGADSLGPDTGQALVAQPKKPARPRGKPQPEKPKRSLFCLGLKNPLRKLCYDIVEWKYPLLKFIYPILSVISYLKCLIMCLVEIYIKRKIKISE
ncbi:Voltage-dependent calcium channel type D subunit alpha-1 [Papilio xuthus]|uniref:Voltage-dependent calcium channel type D subunit alpha-1 n=1 Tax=Papilio xuthus TaxID=66420 RepID=A0A0N1I3U9_PAPXU|nr:Voltage-dependent calcium channel type D subunit alpha-1 [Papilio xuthus]